VIERGRALEELAAEPFDVVVIGGGVTGAGVAGRPPPRRE
jgi:glycerol-3-phosphate dehydrogenase